MSSSTHDWGSMKKTVLDWAANTSGAVSGATVKGVSGLIYGVVFAPDSGTTQPSNNYDVVLNSSRGYDVLNGRGANLNNSAAVFSSCVGFVPVSGPLTLGVTNAGSSNGGEIDLLWR
jgi:hypothetical protein